MADELSSEQVAINELWAALEAMTLTYRAVYVTGTLPEVVMQREAERAREVLARLKPKTV